MRPPSPSPSRADTPVLLLLAVLTCVMSLVTLAPTSASADGSTGSTGRVPRVETPRRDGAPPAPGSDFARLPERCQTKDYGLPVQFCQVTHFGKHRPLLVVWGDSQSLMYLPAYRRAAERDRVNVTMVMNAGCPTALPPARRADSGYTRCEEHDAEALTRIKRLQAQGVHLRLLISSFWSGYRARYKTYAHAAHPRRRYTPYDIRLIRLEHRGTRPLFQELGRLGISTDVVSPSATVPNDARECPAGREPYQCTLPRARAFDHEADNRAWLHRVTRPLVAGSLYIDPSPAYSDAHRVYPYVDGVNTFYDSLHLGERATSTMRRFFQPSMDAMVARRR